jgi:hypothetical protein
MILRRGSNWLYVPALRKRGDDMPQIICGWCHSIFGVRLQRFACCWSGVKRNWRGAVNVYYVESART